MQTIPDMLKYKLGASRVVCAHEPQRARMVPGCFSIQRKYKVRPLEVCCPTTPECIYDRGVPEDTRQFSTFDLKQFNLKTMNSLTNNVSIYMLRPIAATYCVAHDNPMDVRTMISYTFDKLTTSRDDSNLWHHLHLRYVSKGHLIVLKREDAEKLCCVLNAGVTRQKVQSAEH